MTFVDKQTQRMLIANLTDRTVLLQKHTIVAGGTPIGKLTTGDTHIVESNLTMAAVLAIFYLLRSSNLWELLVARRGKGK